MPPIHTLCEFFARSGAQARFYALGRRVVACSEATLAAFESGDRPWPLPWLGQAQLACVFRLGDADDPLIWFLSLPLDEQGLLVPAPRDAFLQRLLETLGRSANRLQGEDQRIDNLMQDNPLAFTPDIVQRAMLHARASVDMGRPASEHFELAEGYLLAVDETGQWPALGLQGLADFSVRHDHAQAGSLAARLHALPVEVLRPLSHCLEHVEPSVELVQALIARGEAAAHEGDLETFSACVRSVGQGETALVGPWYDALLADRAACGPDLLAAIAARGWAHLEHAQRLPLFLDALARHSPAGFTAVVRDMALLPRLRLPLLMYLRQVSPESPVGQCLRPITH
ncbi:DUF3549 family protein [Halomonas sp. HP20-15]|uniref:DUF3549 family protein n=1 Tax=Halomonas sp. HP20-15 TaxID=3085901 RepID=UPI00298276FC|nr:DUF3549 family protein [Halomonas sp. HP20-15]MDW5378180.1 DUF3549 family protein [Halomonas sp. HP20-15]